jgi:endonuclease/exonuclease/phosphatase (EEP) superfamily protein YafD
MVNRFLTGRLLTGLCWLVFLLSLGVWVGIRHADEFALPTLLSYGPRWIWAIPALLVLPACFFSVRRLLPVLASLIVATGPVLQLETAPTLSSRTQPPFTIVTINGGQTITSEGLARLAHDEGADVISLQEWNAPRERQPVVDGYSVICEGSLCVLSRWPMRLDGALDRRLIGGYFMMALRIRLTTPLGDVAVAALHLETVRDGIEAVQKREADALRKLRANILFRDLESRVVSRWLADTREPLLIAGDFNLPSDSAIFRKYWTRWDDAFQAAGWGYGWTKFTRWWGIRIDHILFDRSRWEIVEAKVGDDLGSDHRPVIARFVRY